MTYDIDKSGKVDSLIITDSYPHGVFEAAVKKSAKNWVFEPDNPRRVTKQRVFFK
ncbi:energy transducer TonB [Erwinia aphidicola]